MNQDQLEGLLKQLGGTAKQGWGALTGNPLAIADGLRDRLAGRIQEQRGLSKREADRQLEDFMSRHRHLR